MTIGFYGVLWDRSKLLISMWESMKRSFFTVIFTLLFLGVGCVPLKTSNPPLPENNQPKISVATSSPSQPPIDKNAPRPDWTVLDYYKVIPPDYLEETLETARQDTHFKITIDQKNWYISYRLDELEEQIAVFLKPDGTGVVGVITTGCGPRCFQRVYFLDYQNGKWVSVRERILPDPSDDALFAAFKKTEPALAAPTKTIDDAYGLFEPYLVLPRYGATVQLTDHWTKATLMSWKWTGNTFIRTF